MNNCFNLVDILKSQSNKIDKGITFLNKTKEEFYSYSDLYNDAEELMSLMMKLGVNPKDEMILMIEDSKQFIQTFWACILGGFIPVPIAVGNNDESFTKFFNVWNTLQKPYLITSSKDVIEKIEEYGFKYSYNNIIEEMKSKRIVLSEILKDIDFKIFPSSVITNPTETAFIQFSSGSTGSPKGVVLTHQNLMANINSIIKDAEVSIEDTCISWLPLTHDMGLIGFHLVPLTLGINQYQMPTKLFIRNPILWIKKVSQYRISILSSPNFGYKHFLTFFNFELTEDLDLSCVRLIFNGAEPISHKLCNQFLDTMERLNLKRNSMFPVYGLAEACLAVTFPPVSEELRTVTVDRNSLELYKKVVFKNSCDNTAVTLVDVGYSVVGTKLRITDSDNNELSEETIGYINIKGENVTAGYYNNQSATQNALTDDKWLNTGDLGFIKDNRLIITGRAKDIIFANGQNYYSFDIERVAQEVENLELGQVVAAGNFDEDLNEDRVIIFILAKKRKYNKLPSIIKDLKQHVYSHTGLKIHDVVPVSKIPKTTSGKIQRYKLRENYLKGEYDLNIKEVEKFIFNNHENKVNSEQYTHLEKKLVAILRNMSNIEKISLNDNFLQLGIDSLKASILVDKISKEFSIELQPVQVFRLPTIKKLAEYIENADKKHYDRIGAVEKRDYYELSPEQQSIYALTQLDKNNKVYNIPFVLQIKGALDKDKVEHVFKQLILRHESLRTEFINIKGKIVQKIYDDFEFKVEYITAEESEVYNIIQRFSRPFDLSKGPLLRAILIKVFENKYIMALDVHHIVFDGTSSIILLREFFELYHDKKLQEPRIQYKDYVEWNKQRLQTEEFKSIEQYWLSKFNGEIPKIELPLDYPRPPIQSYEGECYNFTLGEELSIQLKKLAKSNEITLFIMLLSIYNILLYKYSGQEDIIVGVPTAGRNDSDLSQVTGMFVNTLAIRNKLTDSDIFEDFLSDVKDCILDANENQDYRFSQLVQKLKIERDKSRNPLFDTMFMHQNLDYGSVKSEDLEVSPIDFHNKTSKFDMTLSSNELKKDIKFNLEYCSKLFKRETIERVSNNYIKIIKKIVQNPKIKIKDIEILSDEEKKELVYNFNNTEAVYPKNKTIHNLFEEQVEKSPDNIAVMHEDIKVTYRELNERANNLAFILRESGVKPDTVVGIMMERSIEMIIAIFAVLKAGGGYVPIDTKYPEERINYILKDCNGRFILTDKSLMSNGKVLNLNKDILYNGNRGNLKNINNPNNLCYIIYTSGTTGYPKGVMIEHNQILNYVYWGAKQYVNNENLNFPLYTSISFDLTVTSIFIPLITGNSIVIYKEENSNNLIEKMINESKVGVIKLTPSHMKLIEGKEFNDSSVKRLILGGENLSVNLAKNIYKNFAGNIEIYNEYGPTETAVGCMIYKYNLISDNGKSVPIGRPISNAKVYILDKNLKPVPIGVKGELYISGDGVARGYINKPKLTKEKFIENPFIEGLKMYKTGDLARRLSDNIIEFLGRADGQVKIKGYRIEIEEIERQLAKHDNVYDTVVIPKQDKNENDILCAYVVAEHEVSISDLRNYLSRTLPEYMIPSYFFKIDKIPLTINGKVDKYAIESMGEKINSQAEYVEPQSDNEKIIAEIWGDILDIDRVSIKDNFMELGGDSIKATQVVSRLNNLEIHLSARDILTYQTIEQIISSVDLTAKTRTYNQQLLSGERELNPIEEWFFYQKFKNPNYYNQSVLLQLKRDIDLNMIEKAFEKLIKHHDGLRTNYDKERNLLYFNNDHLIKPFSVEKYDISSVTNDKKSQKLEEICVNTKEGFDIFDGLLIKAAVIKYSENNLKLFISAHHLIIDGMSWRILLEDLYVIYNSLELKQPVNLAEKTASLKEWYHELIDFYTPEKINHEREFWEDIERTQFLIPYDFKTTDWTVKNLEFITRSLGEQETQYLLTDANKIYNTDTLTLMLVALAKTLNDWTEDDCFVIEMENHGRHIHNIDLSKTIGWFTAMYPLKLKIDTNNISKQIMSIKEQVKITPNNGIGYGVLKFIKQELRDVKHSKPQIRFNYLGQFDNEVDNDLFSYCSDYTGKEISVINKITANLEINSMIINGKLNISFGYNKKYFDKNTIAGLMDIYLNSLKSILEFLKQEKDIYFTPSDFETLDISEEDLNEILG